MPIFVEGKEKPFDAISFFLKQGLDPVEYDPKTTIIRVKNRAGKVKPYNLTRLLSKMGHKITDASSLNTPEQAISESPVSFLDRLKLSFSVDPDRPAAVKKMKETFSEAKMTEDGTLVVNENGVWKRVDPRGLDAGDLADMAGYLLPVLGFSIGAPLGAAAVGAPTLGFGIPVGAVAGGAAGSGIGEVARQQIGVGMGVKEPGVYLPSLGLEMVGGAAGPYVEKGVGIAWRAGKGQLLKAVPKLANMLAGVPEEVVEWAMKHPEDITSGAVKEVKLPSGRIYKMSKGILIKLQKAVGAAGSEIEKEVAKQAGKAGGQPINASLVKAQVTRYVNELIDDGLIKIPKTAKGAQFDEAAIRRLEHIPEPLKMLYDKIDDMAVKRYSATTQKYVPSLTFEEAHNLKQTLYGLNKKYYGKAADWTDVIHKGYAIAADTINQQLRDISPDYMKYNLRYGELVDTISDAGLDLAEKGPTVKKINAWLTKVAKGTISEPEKETLANLSKAAGKDITSAAAKAGQAVQAQKAMAGRTAREFGKPTDPIRAAILATTMGGEEAMTGNIPGAVSKGLGGALAAVPAAWGYGIKGAHLASQFVKPVLEPVGRSALARALLTKTGMEGVGGVAGQRLNLRYQ